ncbi:HAMP domain-containing protein, partial [Limnochorda pilosa]|uniref:HAMP domain-containing protein n=2 Tax=Limnochorda TaxID=1676651 RepID=UPI0026F19FE6
MALMALVVAGITGYLLFSVSSDELARQSAEALVTELQLHGHVLDMELADKHDAVAALVNRLRQRIGMLTVDDVTTYAPVLHNDIMTSRDYLEVRVANPTGYAQTLSRFGVFGEADLSREPVFQQALAGQSVVGAFTQYDTGDGSVWAVELAQPLIGSDRGVLGVLSALVPAEAFVERLASFSLLAEGESLLVRGDGTVLLRDGQSFIGSPRLWGEDTPAELQRQYQELLAATEATSRLVETQEETYVATVVPLQGADWRLVTLVPARVLTERLIPLRNAAVRNTTILILIAALIAFVFGRALTRGVVEVTGAMQRFAAGDLTYRVQERGRNEVGELARSFNTAAGRLSRLIAD